MARNEEKGDAFAKSRNFIDEVISGITERFSNPFLASFFVGLCVCNYRLLLALFDGKMTYQEKINEIDALLKIQEVNILTFFIYPALVAFLFVSFIPVLNALSAIIREWIDTATHNFAVVKIRRQRYIPMEAQEKLFEEYESRVRDMGEEHQHQIRRFGEWANQTQGLANVYKGLLWKFSYRLLSEQTGFKVTDLQDMFKGAGPYFNGTTLTVEVLEKLQQSKLVLYLYVFSECVKPYQADWAYLVGRGDLLPSPQWLANKLNIPIEDCDEVLAMLEALQLINRSSPNAKTFTVTEDGWGPWRVVHSLRRDLFPEAYKDELLRLPHPST